MRRTQTKKMKNSAQDSNAGVSKNYIQMNHGNLKPISKCNNWEEGT